MSLAPEDKLVTTGKVLLGTNPVLKKQGKFPVVQQAATSAAATVQPVSGLDIFVTFEYCVVSLDWPWIERAFLLLRDWFVPGYA